MTTFTEKVDTILALYADGVKQRVRNDCCTQHRHGFDNVTYTAGEAVQALIAAHQAEISRVLERVEKEVVGDDEEVTGYVRPNGLPSVDLTASYNNELDKWQR